MIIEAAYDSSECSDPQALQDIANTVYNQLVGDLREAIDNGSLVSSLNAEPSGDISELLRAATVTRDFSEVVIPILALISKWYPDWKGQSDTCKNDGNEPIYMKLSGSYYENSLDDCCKRFFSWDIHACTGDTGNVPSGFYPNWDGSESKCLNSTQTADSLPGYMRDNSGQWLENDIESCCERHYNWAYNECISLSGGSSSASASGEWYVNHQDELCQQDCLEADGGPCGGLAKPWDTLYKSPNACCEAKLPWKVTATCEAQSLLTTAVGTSQWYVNREYSKCVKDCDDSSDTNCGGLATKSDNLYGSSNECCEKLWYIERDECTD